MLHTNWQKFFIAQLNLIYDLFNIFISISVFFQLLFFINVILYDI